MLSASIVRRLMLSRFLFNHAMEQANSHNEFAPYAAVNWFQDALEIFFLAAAEHLDVKIDKNTPFDQYIDRLNAKLAPKSLPYHHPIKKLNKIRVSSKHDGIRPDAREVEKATISVQEFFREATPLLFDVDYMAVNLIDLVEDDSIRELLTDANNAYQEGRFADCLISCRKAFYRLFERRYDIRQFQEPDKLVLGGFLTSDAPRYARSKDYIDAYVATPFDYIVLDTPSIDHNLLKDRIDPVTFWNIWRLTPAVYEHPEGRWMVKHDLQMLGDASPQNAAYVLENLVDIILRRQERRKVSRYTHRGANYSVRLKTFNAKIFRKADRLTQEQAQLPDHVRQINVSACVPGLREDDDVMYWQMSYADKGFIVSGFIAQDDLDFDAAIDEAPPEVEDSVIMGAIFKQPDK